VVSPSIPVSSTNKTDCYNITEILVKVELNTITSNLFNDPLITFILRRQTTTVAGLSLSLRSHNSGWVEPVN
jgi:hypothetical protein